LDAGSSTPAKQADASSSGPNATRPTDAGVELADAGALDAAATDFAVVDASAATALPVDRSGPQLPVLVERHGKEAPIFNVTRPIDLTRAATLLPVVVWANGGCLRSDFSWSPLFERWASAGFVVLSLSSASDNLLDMLGQTTKQEHAALIDWAIAQNKSGPYAGRLDVERIMVAGNSCGGVTALEVAGSDDRIAGVFVLSGSSAINSVNEPVMAAIKRPVGYVVGGPEDIAGKNAAGDYDALREGVPAMIVNRREGDHPTVSTDAKILPQDADIALNWMHLVLYGSKDAYADLTSPLVCDKCVAGDWTLKSKHLETLVK
jgi:hypothetical protein